MFFRKKMMRIAYRCFPNLQNLIVIFRDGPTYIRKIIAQMVEYIPVVCQFCLMEHAFIDKSVSFEYLLRPFVVRIAIGSDEAKLEFVETIVEYSLLPSYILCPNVLRRANNPAYEPADSPASGRG